MWSRQYDRDLDDIFAIQDEIAHCIVDCLELTLGLKGAASLVGRPTDDLEAYELYLRGREAVQQRTPSSMRRGLDFFQEAIALDGAYARAHLGMAEAYIGLGVYQAIPPREARAQAEAAIARAVALKPDLAAAPFLRAQLKLYLRPDWRTAEEDLAESLRRAPDDALANVYMAYLHGLLGNREERTRWSERAVARDPLSPFVRGIAGMSHYVTGDHHEALRLYDEGLALDPNSVLCLWQAGMSLDRLGRFDDSLHRFDRAVDLSRGGALMVAFRHRALMQLGRVAEARVIAAALRARARSEYIGESVWLGIALFEGDERAIAEALRLNIDAGTGPTTQAISIDRELKALLPHPRLGPLVRQLSLYAESGAP
jgi:serine/threonine-protein kinase